MSTASLKTSINPPLLKTSGSQGKKIVGKGKNTKPVEKSCF